MAIKERKQITGTTAQINAYAGHEGQIVWDKEKKTFVGMSGTAGENYPLASQAYVDEGLESKEDKGVCLPLSGGKLTGSLIVKGTIEDSNVAGIYTDAQDSKLMLSAGNVNWRQSGGALELYGRTHEYKGGFNLIGCDDNSVYTLSANAPDFVLRWRNEAVVTGILHNTTSAGYIKFNHITDSVNGSTYEYVAFVWTDWVDLPPLTGTLTTLPIPLSSSFFYFYHTQSGGTTNSPVLEHIDATTVRVFNTDKYHRRLRMSVFGAL